MKIWTIKEGEPLPIENCPGRQMRCGIISEMLAERGHDVTWWTSDYFHQTKTRLKDEETIVKLTNHYRLHMLHANKTYQKNISLDRITYSKQLGREFRIAAEKEEKPDAILCSFPLIDFAYEAVQYSKKNKVPIIVDVRDLWPDIIWEHFTKPVQGFVKKMCKSLIVKTDYVMRNADVVIGVIPKCMEFAQMHGRQLSKEDEVYYLAYKEKDINDKDKKKDISFWKEKGIQEQDFVICWIGQISLKRTDFEMVCDVITQMPDCKFVLCGDGVSKKELEEKYSKFPNIIFPGFLNQEELESLMLLSRIGIIPIKNTPDFENTINNKAIEYMAGSLCICTTLKGLLRHTIEENNIGYYFENGEQLKSIIEKLKHHPETLYRCKKNARNYYEAHFKSEIVYGKLCKLIESYNR